MLPRVLLVLFVLLLPAAAQAERPDAAMLARLKANGVEAYGVNIDRPNGFPDIVLVSRSIPDAGPIFLGGFVGRDWIGGRDSRDTWIRLAGSAMRAQGWPHLTTAARKALALRWIRNALPPGDTARRAPGDPGAAHHRPPSVMARAGTVIVTGWITRRRESVGGLRTTYPTGPTLFIFATDGTLSLVPPDKGGPNGQ